MLTRREILKKAVLLAGAGFPSLKVRPLEAAPPVMPGTDNPLVSIFRSVNGSAADNMAKVCELLGGVDKLVNKTDVVVIKPNVQWWNHGSPNLSALFTLVHLIMRRPGGFTGEVIVAENCHRGNQPWNYAGWKNRFERNSSMPGVRSFNDLTKKLKREFGDRYSTVHWINVKSGANRVFSAEDGPGYVFCDGSGGVPKISFGNGATGQDYRETIMTYPIFETDRGTLIDYKHGLWEKDRYDDTRLKFINFAALNHHSTYCGFSSLIKNYLGVSDLSGGPDPHNGGMLTEKYYNFHSFPFDKWAPGPRVGMIGAEIGVFLKTIRKADLHVATAEWIGLADRLHPPVVRTKAVLASTDPVALDYHSAKYILFPNSKLHFHNPDAKDSPSYHCLKACSDHGGGILDERKVGFVSYDQKTGKMQNYDEAAVLGEKKWGSNTRAITKYLIMRYADFLL